MYVAAESLVEQATKLEFWERKLEVVGVAMVCFKKCTGTHAWSGTACNRACFRNDQEGWKGCGVQCQVIDIVCVHK